MREEGAHLGQNLKTLHIQVAPILDSAVVQPGDGTQGVNLKPLTPQRNRVRQQRQGEKVHLVLGDDHPFTGQRQSGRLAKRQTEIGTGPLERQLQRRVEQA